MEKRILVAGCSHYLREYITNGLYYISNEYYLRIVPITVVDRYASNPYGIGNGDLVNADILDSFEDFGALIYYTPYSNADFSLQETIKNNAHCAHFPKSE